MNNVQIIITCEHGGNEVPRRFSSLFHGRERLLNSHRGYDRYALAAGEYLAREMRVPFYYSKVTRLLIDLNRSLHHRKLFSKISGQLKAEEKEYIINTHYLPYRRRIDSSISASVKKATGALHISVHTFAPVMDGKKKNADIGLLYDPARYPERVLCLKWQKLIKEKCPGLKVRRNYPYLGKADGLVTYLRRAFSPGHYTGIELEINQKIMKREKQQEVICDMLVSTLGSLI